MTSRSNRTIIQAVFLPVFIITGSFNVSYGQAKAEQLDKLISTHAEYEQFNGSVLVAEKGRYKVLPVEGQGEFVNPDDGASLVSDRPKTRMQ